jgi:hypothetical protein
MWIVDLLDRFGEIYRSQFGTRPDPSAVEREVADIGTRTEVGSRQLHAIEESQAWVYPDWWPKLSPMLREPVVLPTNLETSRARRDVVEYLQNQLKHIEVVSVLLRFVCPEEFGIMSPPVSWLLALPYEKDHVEYYLRYISILRGFKDYYALSRIADVDMALWSAAHGHLDYPSVVEAMYEDPYFQRVRLTNLLSGLGQHWKSTNRHRMLLAESLLKTDYKTAAVITAKVYEGLVIEIAGRLGLPHPIRTRGETMTGALVRSIARLNKIGGLAVPAENFAAWWRLRRKAIHDDPELTKKEAQEFTSEINDLCSTVEKWTPK